MSSLRGLRHCGRRRGLRAGPLVAFVLSISAATGARLAPAHADEPPSARRLAYGRELGREGLAHVRAERWAEGRQALREALDVKELSVLLYYLGLCELGLGNLREAERRFRRAVELANAPGVTGEAAALRRQLIEDAGPPLRDVEARLPRVTLRWAPRPPPPGATLTLDGEALEAAEASLPLRLDPGAHTLVARAPGHQSSQHSFRLDERQELALALTLEPDAASVAFAAPPAAAARPRAFVEPAFVDWQRPAGVVGIGFGVSLLIAGAVATSRVDALERRYEGDPWFRAYRASAPGRDICELADDGHEAPPGVVAASARGVRSTCDAAGRFSALQYVFYGAGAAFMAAGAYFAFFAPTPAHAAPDRAAWRFVPTLGPQQAGVGARLAF